jgi:hypothetical protein
MAEGSCLAELSGGAEAMADFPPFTKPRPPTGRCRAKRIVIAGAFSSNRIVPDFAARLRCQPTQ